METGEIVKRLGMPETYGTGYKISPDDDLKRHFIPTDYQPTHINCAYPYDNGVIVTLLIQGAIGYFDNNESYREITRGFRGCHGARIDKFTKNLYFTDSPAGILWFMDFNSGHIKQRYSIDSNWLHDVCQIEESIFAGGISDKNEIQIFDTSNDKQLARIDASKYGKSVMFVNAGDIPTGWVSSTATIPDKTTKYHAEPDTQYVKEYCPLFYSRKKWKKEKTINNISTNINISTFERLQYEYILASPVLILDKGEYLFSAEIHSIKGAVSIGLLDFKTNSWLTNLCFDSVITSDSEPVIIRSRTAVKIIIASHNIDRNYVDFIIRNISLKKRGGNDENFLNGCFISICNKLFLLGIKFRKICNLQSH